jgi:hypothetical protein
MPTIDHPGSYELRISASATPGLRKSRRPEQAAAGKPVYDLRLKFIKESMDSWFIPGTSNMQNAHSRAQFYPDGRRTLSGSTMNMNSYGHRLRLNYAADIRAPISFGIGSIPFVKLPENRRQS